MERGYSIRENKKEKQKSEEESVWKTVVCGMYEYTCLLENVLRVNKLGCVVRGIR